MAENVRFFPIVTYEYQKDFQNHPISEEYTVSSLRIVS